MMDSDEKPLRLPAIKDALRELKRKPEEAERLLSKWLKDADDAGYVRGLNEGLRRAAEPVKRTTLTELTNRACSEEGHGEFGKTCFHAVAAPTCVCGHDSLAHKTVHRGGCIGRPNAPCGPDCRMECMRIECLCVRYRTVS